MSPIKKLPLGMLTKLIPWISWISGDDGPVGFYLSLLHENERIIKHIDKHNKILQKIDLMGNTKESEKCILHSQLKQLSEEWLKTSKALSEISIGPDVYKILSDAGYTCSHNFPKPIDGYLIVVNPFNDDDTHQYLMTTKMDYPVIIRE